MSGLRVRRDRLGRVRCNGHRVPGVLRALERRFWPTYQSALARAGTPGGQFRGVQTGMVVDRQLCQYVNGTPAQRRRLPLRAETRLLLRFFARARWQLVQAQVPVAVPHLGTCLDLLVYDLARRRYVAVEIKTGYGDYFQRSLGQVRHRQLRDIDSSPLHHAVFQLLATMELFRTTYPTQPLDADAGCVVRVHQGSVEAYPLPDFQWHRRALAVIREELCVRAEGRGDDG